VHGEPVGGPGPVQPCDDVAVEFDGMQVRQAFEQGLVSAPRPGPISTTVSPGCG